MFVFNFKYNLTIYFCILLMIVGCQNTTGKIVVENKYQQNFQKKDNASSNNKNFTKNKIIKREITLNVNKLEPKQNENDGCF